MKPLTDFFGSSFLINLSERVDRLEAAREGLERIGSGVGPGNVIRYPARRVTEAQGFPSPGVRGCFESHMDCLRQAVEAGSRGVLVLEDDITFTSALPRLAPALVEHLSSCDWDMVFFGHELTGAIPRANSKSEPGELQYLDSIEDFQCAHFYAVNGKTLPRLLKFLEALLARPAGSPDGGPMPVDGAYNFFREKNPDIVTLLVSPKLGWQRSSRSDLTPRWFDRVPMARSVLGGLRDIKQRAQRWRE